MTKLCLSQVLASVTSSQLTPHCRPSSKRRSPCRTAPASLSAVRWVWPRTYVESCYNVVRVPLLCRQCLGAVAVHSCHFHIVFWFAADPPGMVVVLVVGILHAHRCVWTPCDDCCVMALGQLWTLHAPCPLVAVHRRAHRLPPPLYLHHPGIALPSLWHACLLPCVLAATRLLIAL